MGYIEHFWIRCPHGKGDPIPAGKEDDPEKNRMHIVVREDSETDEDSPSRQDSDPKE